MTRPAAPVVEPLHHRRHPPPGLTRHPRRDEPTDRGVDRSLIARSARSVEGAAGREIEEVDAVEVDVEAERLPAIDRSGPGRAPRRSTSAGRGRRRALRGDEHAAGIEFDRDELAEIDDLARHDAAEQPPVGSADASVGAGTPRTTSRPTRSRTPDRPAPALTVVERQLRCGPTRSAYRRRPTRPPIASTTFIVGVPTNCATKTLRGWSYTSIGTPHCTIAPCAHHRQPIAHRHRLVVVVRDVQRREAESSLQPHDDEPRLASAASRRGSTSARPSAATVGRARSPVPSATRWRWPPESVLGRRSSTSVSCKAVRDLLDPTLDDRPAARGRRRIGNPMFSATVRCGYSAYSWNAMAMLALVRLAPGRRSPDRRARRRP